MKNILGSPISTKEKNENQMDFSSAIKEVIADKKITRIVWASDEYGLLKDGFLTIKTSDGFHQWIVSDGDMLANDWIVVED